MIERRQVRGARNEKENKARLEAPGGDAMSNAHISAPGRICDPLRRHVLMINRSAASPLEKIVHLRQRLARSEAELRRLGTSRLMSTPGCLDRSRTHARLGSVNFEMNDATDSGEDCMVIGGRY